MSTTATDTHHLVPHPAADLFPMLSDTELEQLAADITANGQKVPIIVQNNQILIDGRNRLEACRRAGIEPVIKDMADAYPGVTDVVGFIISANLHRRHLTDEQRDQIGSRLMTMKPNGPRVDPQNAGRVGIAAAAALVQSTPARIERARTIERADPALADRVIKGDLTKGQALQIVNERKRDSQSLELHPTRDTDAAANTDQDAEPDYQGCDHKFQLAVWNCLGSRIYPGDPWSTMPSGTNKRERDASKQAIQEARDLAQRQGRTPAVAHALSAISDLISKAEFDHLMSILDEVAAAVQVAI